MPEIVVYCLIVVLAIVIGMLINIFYYNYKDFKKSKNTKIFSGKDKHILIKKGKRFVVQKDSSLIAKTYKIQTKNRHRNEIIIKINNKIYNYANNSYITLEKNDVIEVLSHSVILK